LPGVSPNAQPSVDTLSLGESAAMVELDRAFFSAKDLTMVDDLQKKKMPTLSKEFERFDELRVYRDSLRGGLDEPWARASVTYYRTLRALRERFGSSDQEIVQGPVEIDFGECRSMFEFRFDAQDSARFELKLTQALERFTIVDPESKHMVAGGIPVTEYDALASKLTELFKKRWTVVTSTLKALPSGEPQPDGP
jgi:hypothetical protein